MCVRVCLYISVYMYLCLHVYVCVLVYMCLCVYMSMSVYVYIYGHMCLCVYVCVCIYVSLCVFLMVVLLCYQVDMLYNTLHHSENLNSLPQSFLMLLFLVGPSILTLELLFLLLVVEPLLSYVSTQRMVK